ncbi:uncharacterized protein LOC127837363 isoform X2 [Dreissena polymorpha]|uniref:uncharacterized protein LOC127837363 isoform X2 n=1 Tax=Dreissena polymorpha TaxID=45954 RepID=UPI0022655528|nr:uncharacterized protein LOC127837363 isoform X2 [Dreissena polymorpha]
MCKANLDTACEETADCDTTTNPNSSCPATGTKSCRCDTGYTQQRGMCKANLDTACGETADCDTTTNPHSSCPATGTKNCRCDIGYTQRETRCKANLGSACSTTTDCDTATTHDAVCDRNAVNKICVIGANGDCRGRKTCVTASICVNDTCRCSTGYFQTPSNRCSYAFDNPGGNSAVNAISMLLLLTSCYMAKFLKN